MKSEKKVKHLNVHRDVLHCVDKAIGNHSYYDDTVLGMTVELMEGETVKLKRAVMAEDYAEYYNGEWYCETVDELMEYFKDVTRHYYDNETRLVYTDNLPMVALLLREHIHSSFGKHSISLLPYYSDMGKRYVRCRVEIRSINSFVDSVEHARDLVECWSNDSDATVIREFAQHLMDDVFIPNGKAYLTVQQIGRHRMTQAAKSEGDCETDRKMPYFEYAMLSKAKRGGFCFNNFPSVQLEEPIIGCDRRSCYPYLLISKQYPMTQFEATDPARFSEFKGNSDYCIWGVFEITYSTNAYNPYTKILNPIKRAPFPQGEHQKITLTLTDADFEFLEHVVSIEAIECKALQVARAGYLPKWLVSIVADMYRTKQQMKTAESYQYEQAKLELNSIAGNLQRVARNKAEYDALPKYINLSWGIWLTAYARTELLNVVLMADTPIYGDTDSIYCIDNDYNRQIIWQANDDIRRQLYTACIHNDLNFDELFGLGEFAIENEIEMFRAAKTKQYCYKTKGGEYVVKATGYVKGTVTFEEVYNDHMPEMTATVAMETPDGEVVLEDVNFEVFAILDMFKGKFMD